MDNTNNTTTSNIIDNQPSYYTDGENSLKPPFNGEYQPPKPNKFVEILIALAKCAGFLFIWLGVQLILSFAVQFAIFLQNPSITEEALTEKLLGYSIELTVASNLLALGIYFLIYYIAKKSLLKKVDISLPDKQSYLPTLIAGATGQFVTSLVLGLLMNVIKIFPQKWVDALNENGDIVTNANPVLSFFAVVILAPVFEEILCRGLILGTLRKTMPKWYAIVLSASIFGIIHGNPIQFIYATALGILLGWLYTKFDSIWIPILCHLAFNLVSTLAGYVDPENILATVLLGLIIYASVPAFVLAIIYINLKKFTKKTDNVSVNPVLVPQIPVNNAPEYNASVLTRLEEQIEDKYTNNDKE